MKKIVISVAVLSALGSNLIAGGKLVEPEAPVIPVSTAIIAKPDTSGFYAGGAAFYNNIYSTDYNWFDDGTATQDEVGGFTAIIGYNYNEYLAFEARASKSFFQEDYADEYHFSVFAKPQYRFRNAKRYEENYFSIYGLLGFGYVNIEGTDGDTPGDPTIVGKTLIDDWTFQYGLGLSYTFVDTDHPEDDSGDWSIFAEYTNYMTDQEMDSTYLYDYNDDKYDELSMNGLSIGVSYQF
jgi:hypothetical protein